VLLYLSLSLSFFSQNIYLYLYLSVLLNTHTRNAGLDRDLAREIVGQEGALNVLASFAKACGKTLEPEGREGSEGMRRDGDGDDQEDWLSDTKDMMPIFSSAASYQRYDAAEEEEGQSEKAEGAKESRWSEGEEVAVQETKKRGNSGAQAHFSYEYQECSFLILILLKGSGRAKTLLGLQMSRRDISRLRAMAIAALFNLSASACFLLQTTLWFSRSIARSLTRVLKPFDLPAR